MSVTAGLSAVCHLRSICCPLRKTRVIDGNVLSGGMKTVLGGMALVLACVGVYGVMSVTERTREIGIRMALGAEAGSVVGMMLRRSVFLTGIGLLIGLVCSAALARLLASLIWGVSALDVQTFGAVSAALVGVALLASYVPARRAARVDPLISLRCE